MTQRSTGTGTGQAPEKMEELILRVLQGHASAEEEALLDAWVAENAENRQIYEEIREVWTLAERASPSVRALKRPSAAELVEAARAEDSSPAEAPRRPLRKRHWGISSLLAAAAIAALAFGLQSVPAPPPGGPQYFSVAELSTGIGETVTAQLDDGTIVRLGGDSHLRLDGTDGSRNVWLDGQAFFAVAHDPEAPFTVRTAAGNARVLGTRFDVRARDADLRLVVVDGRVQVSAAADEQHVEEVGASQMTQVIDGERVFVSEISDVFRLLEWMEGSLIFQSTPLREVARELEERYGIPVEVVDSTVAERTITAWFNDEPFVDAVSVICRAADVRCDVTEERVRIGL